jgi:hypothetical protein
VIVLSNGQMYQVPADSVVYVNGQPVAWSTVRPGTRVTVPPGAQLVELRNGQYVLVQQSMDPATKLRGSSPSNTLAEGDVIRVDPTQRVIVLSNGQMYQVPADSVVYVNGQPVAWSTVRPGTRVMVPTGAQLVELRNGQYVLVQQAPGAVVAAPGTIVTTPAVRQTLHGRVTDVGRNDIEVKTGTETFEIKMPNAKSAGIRSGDNVQIDMTFTPGSPSALPR